MPLKSGRKAISGNIRELMETWKRKGRIGKSKKMSKRKALKVAAAIAYRKAREGRKVRYSEVL